MTYTTDKEIKNQIFTNETWHKKEFEQCHFENCDLSAASLIECEFIDCKFSNCNFSNTKLNSSGLKNLQFNQCKLIGLDFSDASDFLFEVNFTDCILEFCVFHEKNCKKMQMEACKVHECDFSRANCSEACFDTCDMSRTVFQQTDLRKADLRTAINYQIHPENNKIQGARFSYPGVIGLLSEYKIDID